MSQGESDETRRVYSVTIYEEGLYKKKDGKILIFSVFTLNSAYMS